ncbi:MAG: hypothetical protein EPN45_09660 [Rhizobiaceae bacterium]|nr:MAG: hypothetical protein EPN45_09660 [Rhizobiaceae bacterium]
MSDEDDIPESVRRGVEKAMYRRPLVKTTVETRQRFHGFSKPSKPKPVVEAFATDIPLTEPGDDWWVIVFKSVLPDGKRIVLRTIRSPETVDHEAIIREYIAEGRIVRWVGKKPAIPND